MPRIQPLQPETATGPAKELLDAARKKMGRVPNILKTMAHSPAALRAYMDFSATLAGGLLPAKTREAIALAVGEANGCEYCVAAHSALGKMAGLDPEEITRSRRGESADSKTNAALRLARRIIDTKGFVSDDDLAAVRQAGWSDAEIAEIVAAVSLNIYTNYFNHVAETESDFPKAPPLEGKPALAAAGA